MATIQPRRSARTGKVRYTVTVRNHEGSKSKTFSSRRSAEDWAAAMETDLGRGEIALGHGKVTFREALIAYRRHRWPDYKPPADGGDDKKLWPKDSRFNITKFWESKLGARKLSSITRPELLRLRDKLTDDGASASTVNHHVSVLCSAFQIAVARGWLTRNPASDVGQTHDAAKLRRKEPKGRVRFLSDEERVKLLAACKTSSEPVLYPLVLAALSTGCRAGELLALEWRDVDLERGMASVRESKNGESRAVPLKGPVLDELRRMKKAAVRGTADYVFRPRSGTGGRRYNYRRDWLPAVKAAEIEDFRFHDLRHSAASYLAQAGANLYLIGAVLGHRTPSMTARYSHLVGDNIAEAGDLLAKRLDSTPTT